MIKTLEQQQRHLVSIVTIEQVPNLLEFLLLTLLYWYVCNFRKLNHQILVLLDDAVFRSTLFGGVFLCFAVNIYMIKEQIRKLNLIKLFPLSVKKVYAIIGCPPQKQ